jgi:hypothetical protein
MSCVAIDGAVRTNTTQDRKEGPAGWEEAGPRKPPDVYERGSGGIVRAAPRIDKGQSPDKKPSPTAHPTLPTRLF